MSSFKTFLRKIKYNLKYLFTSDLHIPTDFKIFTRKNSTYQNFIYDHCKSDEEEEIDLNKNLKIFGMVTDKYELSEDIFTNFDFSNRKLKPAFFNKADVKVPYEASRLQYLQKLKKGKIDVNKFPKIYWNSPMDVAIRNINLIFHYLSIEKNNQIPEILGNNKDLLSAYISQHYEFIKSNLENEGNVVGNHYLIELTSILLTIATFSFDKGDEEYKYYHDELMSELQNQFYEDGTSFEGSSHYAAFVTEALIICKLSIEEVDKNSIIIQMLDEIIKSNRVFLSKLMIKGELSQIGDNDSGRLFYFGFSESMPLKMTWLIDLIGNLYKEEDFIKIESKFRKQINNPPPAFDNYNRASHKPIKVFTKEYQTFCFKDFGLYVWRNEDEYFSLRCGPIGQNGIGGHSHYDQLSIECFTNNNWIARDPGTGTYTDDIQLRNSFRSLDFHWGPNVKLKFPKEDEFDCFKLNYMGDGEVITFDNNNFLGLAEFNGKRIYRKVSIANGFITIEDFSKDVELEEYTSWGEQNSGVKVKFSEGYKRFS